MFHVVHSRFLCRIILKLNSTLFLFNCVAVLNHFFFFNFQLTEIGLSGQNGHCVLKFVMAENKQDTGSAITQLHFMVVKTARAITEIQELVTILNVQVRPWWRRYWKILFLQAWF